MRKQLKNGYLGCFAKDFKGVCFFEKRCCIQVKSLCHKAKDRTVVHHRLNNGAVCGINAQNIAYNAK